MHERTHPLFTEKSLNVLVDHVTMLTLARDVDVPLDKSITYMYMHMQGNYITSFDTLLMTCWLSYNRHLPPSPEFDSKQSTDSGSWYTRTLILGVLGVARLIVFKGRWVMHD